MALRILAYAVTVLVTHYVATFLQTFLHFLLGHKKVGRGLYFTHVYYHHAHYSRGRMVSEEYIPDGKNAAPSYLFPVTLVAWAVYRLLSFNFFLVHISYMVFSYFAHEHLHTQFHLEKSWLDGFAWFRKRQQLHFEHHRHTAKNFALLHPFWDRLLGTYQDAGASG